jgi:hypothetical protein
MKNTHGEVCTIHSPTHKVTWLNYSKNVAYVHGLLQERYRVITDDTRNPYNLDMAYLVSAATIKMKQSTFNDCSKKIN